MVQAVIQLGGNMPGTLEKIQAFPVWLSTKGFDVGKQSSIYKTAPWGMVGVPDFLNQILLVFTTKKPEEVLDDLLSYEMESGRKRSKETGYTSRIIDADLLLYGAAILETPKLILPHPRMHLRRFIMLPLSELAPNLLHPVLKKTMQDLFLSCPDKGEVHIFGHG